MIDGVLLLWEGAVVAFEGAVELAVAAAADEGVEQLGEGFAGDRGVVVVVEVEPGDWPC